MYTINILNQVSVIEVRKNMSALEAELSQFVNELSKDIIIDEYTLQGLVADLLDVYGVSEFCHVVVEGESDTKMRVSIKDSGKYITVQPNYYEASEAA